MSKGEEKTGEPVKQSFEEFRGWLRGYLEEASGVSPEGVERVLEELEKVDTTLSAGPFTIINPSPVVIPWSERHPAFFEKGLYTEPDSPVTAPNTNDMPCPGGKTFSVTAVSH